MTIHYDGACARLEAAASVEDAEPLAQWLLGQVEPVVDVRACAQPHAAVLQVLLALQPTLQGPAADPVLDAVLARDVRQVDTGV
jgi:hypothetical protein